MPSHTDIAQATSYIEQALQEPIKFAPSNAKTEETGEGREVFDAVRLHVFGQITQNGRYNPDAEHNFKSRYQNNRGIAELTGVTDAYAKIEKLEALMLQMVKEHPSTLDDTQLETLHNGVEAFKAARLNLMKQTHDAALDANAMKKTIRGLAIAINGSNISDEDVAKLTQTGFDTYAEAVGNNVNAAAAMVEFEPKLEKILTTLGIAVPQVNERRTSRDAARGL